jgi:hypothetical protein
MESNGVSLSLSYRLAELRRLGRTGCPATRACGRLSQGDTHLESNEAIFLWFGCRRRRGALSQETRRKWRFDFAGLQQLALGYTHALGAFGVARAVGGSVQLGEGQVGLQVLLRLGQRFQFFVWRGIIAGLVASPIIDQGSNPYASGCTSSSGTWFYPIVAFADPEVGPNFAINIALKPARAAGARTVAAKVDRPTRRLIST